jgi:ankyrin repeat protein
MNKKQSAKKQSAKKKRAEKWCKKCKRKQKERKKKDKILQEKQREQKIKEREQREREREQRESDNNMMEMLYNEWKYLDKYNTNSIIELINKYNDIFQRFSNSNYRYQILNISPIINDIIYRQLMDIVRLLIQIGVTFKNLVSIENITPLHCVGKNLELAQLIIDYGGYEKINQMNRNNMTPLCYTLKIPNNLKMAQLLIDNGADVNIKSFGCTPLSNNCRFLPTVESIRLLINNGADVNPFEKKIIGPLTVPLTNLCRWYINNNIRDMSILEELLINGADIPMNYRYTIGEQLSARRRKDIFDLLERYDIFLPYSDLSMTAEELHRNEMQYYYDNLY